MGLLFTGCWNTQEKIEPVSGGECIVGGTEAPLWVCGSYKNNDFYTEVGSAPMSKLGQNFTRNEALANARANLVNQIKLLVKNKTEGYMRSVGVNSNEMIEKVSTQVSKQTSEMILTKTSQMAYHYNAGDNTIYLMIGVSKNSIDTNVVEKIKDFIPNEEQLKNSEDKLNNL